MGIALLAGCTREAPPRRQWVIVVDTDAPTLDSGGDVSRAAIVDTVRVDRLDPSDNVRVLRELSVTSQADWPLSFGVMPDDSGSVRLRIRAFRARDAEATVERGTSTLAPPPGLTIDRVVVVPEPADDSVTRVLVKLGVDCFGQPASFRTRTSCVEGRPTPFDAPLPAPSGARASLVGSSTLAQSTPCAGAAPPGRICIPGGLSVLGSSLLAGYEDDFITISPLPMRMVRVSPFYMDETEVTVGRARKWLDRLKGTPPFRVGAPEVPSSRYCTMSDDPASDALPLNCVTEATAQELCELEGGTLPTEAEWNHAATGRGEARRYPWGETSEGCCNASVARFDRDGRFASECPGEGPEAVGSHRPKEACNGQGDVSRDGVVDLAGSLSEMLADRSRPLDDPCWGPPFGILLDPVCRGSTSEPIATRGGSWAAGSLLSIGMRSRHAIGADRGFRCVYRGPR